MHYTILYRGPLSSCNYGCGYCPFAKRQESRDELNNDRRALHHFLKWVDDQETIGHEISVLFTPWGEALVRPWYQQALIRLTSRIHVRKAAIQTNLSCPLDWVAECDLTKLGLWCSYHPTETTIDRFVKQCSRLSSLGARYSVGVVGTKEQIADAYALRKALPQEIYIWINAIKRVDDYYTRDEAAAFAAIDPLFEINNTRHPSLGRPCRAGESVFSVDGAGTMRRCHFIAAPIGNIYDANWEQSLRPSPCTNESCGCHIGYVHMPELNLYERFGDGVLERIPREKIWNSDVVMPNINSQPIAKPITRLSLRQVSASG